MGGTVNQQSVHLNTWNFMSNRILEAAPDSFVLVDARGLILFVNRETIRMFGFEREELLGRAVEVLIPERFRKLHVGYRGSFVSEKSNRSMRSGLKLLGLRKDGSEFPVDIGLSLMGSGENCLVGAFIRDISAQKRVEANLRQSREYLEERVRERTHELEKANSALESEVAQRKRAEILLRGERDRAQKYLDLAGVIFVAIDSKQKVILLNKKGCEVLGCSEEEALGKNWFDFFIPEKDRSETQRAFSRLMSGEIEPVENFENRVLARSGSERLIAWHNTVIRDEKNGIEGTLSSGLDITEKTEMEQKMRQAEKLAAVGQMVSGLAHEIGTPLSVIGGRAEYMLRKMEQDDPLRENLGRIIGQMERITKIVNNFLAFTRTQPIDSSPVRVKPLFDEILPLFEHQVTRQRIKTIMDVPESLPEIKADRDQIQQVFFNIILNALQVMPEGGRLTVKAREREMKGNRDAGNQSSFIGVDIADTGTGILPENLSKIFDPFFTTKEAGKGTGLGLSVGYGIVKGHGGWIDVDSEIGKGTVFSVMLPLAH